MTTTIDLTQLYKDVADELARFNRQTDSYVVRIDWWNHRQTASSTPVVEVCVVARDGVHEVFRATGPTPADVLQALREGLSSVLQAPPAPVPEPPDVRIVLS